MIKINLLADARVKHGAPGEQTVAIGAGIIVLLGVLVYFTLHRSQEETVARGRKAQRRLQAAINILKEETKDFDLVKQQADAVRGQQAAIDALNGARAVPAWLLRELSNILTRDHKPMGNCKAAASDAAH